MRAKRIITTLLSCCFFGFFHTTTFALPMAKTMTNVSCPSIQEIQSYQFAAGFPYGFDSQLNQPKYIVGAASESLFGGAASGYDTPSWTLVMYPLHVGSNETIQNATQSVLNQLIPVSSTPFTSEVIDEVSVTFCAYTLPGNPSVSALAYYDDSDVWGDDYDDEDDYDDSDDDWAHKKSAKATHSAQKHHHKRLMRIAKFLMK